jgi:hypothetical protein
MAVTCLLGKGTPTMETSFNADLNRFLDEVSGSRPEEDQGELSCGSCYEKKAEIFQVTGNYCLHCWQEETHPDV